MASHLIMSQSPHDHTGLNVSRCIWTVTAALVPAWIMAVIIFGWQALWVTSLSIAACTLTEWAIDKFLFRRPSTLRNGSAILTGLLLGMNLPSILPWWMIIIGAIVAIGIGKMSFGGLGCNIWNPALVGRVFLLISFPAAMTTWPVDAPGLADASSGATMLQHLNYSGADTTFNPAELLNMSVGFMNGSLGETGSIALLGGCAFLIWKRIISWHIPVSILTSAALFSWIFGGNPLPDIFAGGLILGACFMATDYVTSPMTHKGQMLYGCAIGGLTIIIRRFGSYPEGVSFAILIMNSFTPLINRYMRPAIFGEREAKRTMRTQRRAVRLGEKLAMERREGQ